MPDLPSLETIWQDFPVLEDAWPLLLLGLRLAIALMLYLFLFSAFRALLVELRPAATAPVHAPAPEVVRRRPPPPARRRETPRWLEVVDCEGSPDLVGRRYPLERVTLIGREVDSTAVLPDPRVSARHARLMSRNGDWWLEDLDSMNGTFIDEQRVEAATRVDPGAELRFGPVVTRLASRSSGR